MRFALCAALLASVVLSTPVALYVPVTILVGDVVRVGTQSATCTGPSGCVVVYSDLCASPCETSNWLVAVARQGEQAQVLRGRARAPTVNGRPLPTSIDATAVRPQNVAFPHDAAGVRVWAYPFIVTPSDRLVMGPDAANVTIPAPSVLVYLDLMPTYRFVHPTGILLVGSGGDYTAASWWPVLNGRNAFARALPYSLALPLVIESA
eukprot:m51a1_g8144 hypothetical protein (207) ;mRNA; f:32342-33016